MRCWEAGDGEEHQGDGEAGEAPCRSSCVLALAAPAQEDSQWKMEQLASTVREGEKGTRKEIGR